nr:M14 family zinc carboxypeptidase [uncultured Capnocytophaga sp.]
MEIPYYKETRVEGKYVPYGLLETVLKDYEHWYISEGLSEKLYPIPLYRIGEGKKCILLWSQMHGNESTTTRALLDLFKLFAEEGYPFNNCQLYIIPMLNPDGAIRYTRVNGNGVDLNRDAVALSQRESQFLRSVYNRVQPHFCFNLHDQRTIFGVGDRPATVSFLAPAVDKDRNVTRVRRKAARVITEMNNYLQLSINGFVGRFDDSFNPNCTGDQYSLLGTPTILIESGFYPGDYQRELTRKYIAQALYVGLSYINDNKVDTEGWKHYLEIPENKKCFRDYCIVDDKNPDDKIFVQLEEVLEGNKIIFIPKPVPESEGKDFLAHKTYQLSEICLGNNCNIRSCIPDILAYIRKEVENI